MHVKQPNFTSFNTDKKIESAILEKQSPAEAKQHPEYGITPYNAQCNECLELIDQRTINSRQFIDPKRKNYTLSQTSYFPLHYKKSESDIWRTIDQRLRPTADEKVFVASDQPVPTKLDLNRKSTSLTVKGFEFEFGRNLSMFFYDDNFVYTRTETGDYSNYTVGEEGLHVKNMWPGIDMLQQYSVGQIKSNYVINAPLQLPIAHGWMVIEDHFSLPEGYTFNESPKGERLNDGKYYRGDYTLKNAEGQTLITYEKPVYVDAKAFGMHGMYKLIRNNNDYTLQMLVPVEWLNNADNTYPLVVDPVVFGATKQGDFTQSGNPSANFAFTSMALGSCDYHQIVHVPGKSTLTDAYVDVEYTLTYDNTCGTPPLPPPFCTFSMVTMEVQNDVCNTTTGQLSCNPAQPPFTGTCTTDSNLVPGASPIHVNSFVPNYLACIPPQCPDFDIPFTLKNRDQQCGDVCGYLCARGNVWRTLVVACTVDGFITGTPAQVCAGQPVTFTAHPNCGVPPYHFIWSSDGFNTSDTVYGTTTFVAHPQADIIMQCMILDACDNLVISNDVNVSVTAAPAADAGPDASLCADGGTIQLGGSPTTSAGATVQWSGETSTYTSWINSTTSPNPAAIVPGGTVDTFFYVVKATNSACFRTDTMWVYAGANPVALIDTSGPTSICSNETVTLNVTQQFVSYAWNSGDATQSITTNIAGPYYAVVTDGNGCRDTSNVINVNVVQAPVVDAGSAPPLCGNGGSVLLGGSPAVSPPGSIFAWSGQDATVESWLDNPGIQNPTATVPAGSTGNFFYVLTASNPISAACVQTDTVWVVSAPDPVAVIDSSGPTKLCANQTVTLSVTGTFASYEWSNGLTSQSITVGQAGNYWATVTDSNGCKDTTNIINVSAITVPPVHVYPDTLIMYGDTVRLYTDLNLATAGIDSFNWSPELNISCITCPNPYASPPADQYYSLIVHAGGCTVSDSALIRILYPNNFFIPNAFTPNGDGNNDDFYIKAQSGVKVLLFQVFNRIGEKVHEGSFPWDGNYKTKPAPPGVYIYIFKLGLFGDEYSVLRKGSVTMIR
jgi:gliding motility-associated-like protein